MANTKPTRSGRLSREEQLAGVLSILQAEIEKAPGGEEAKRMRRQVLRGLRLATWCFLDRTTGVNEIEFEFRNELFFGQSPTPPRMQKVIDKRSGTTNKPVPTGANPFPATERSTGPKVGDKPKSQRPSPDANPVN